MFEPNTSWVSVVAMAVPLVAPCLLRRFDIGRLAERALERAGLSHKVAVDYMGAPDSRFTDVQLSRQLAGRGPEHLSADRLTRLPEAFWAAFILELGETFGWVDHAESRDRRVAQRVVQRHADHACEERLSA